MSPQENRVNLVVTYSSLLFSVLYVLSVLVSSSSGQDYMTDAIYMTPRDGVSCKLDRVPRRNTIQPVTGVCWDQIRKLVYSPSMVRMNSMGLYKYCTKQFNTIEDIASEGRPKFMYRNVRIRCHGYRAKSFGPKLPNKFTMAYRNTYNRVATKAEQVMQDVKHMGESMWPFPAASKQTAAARFEYSLDGA